MADSDLLISIGAETSSFTAAVKAIDKQFDKLQRDLTNKKVDLFSTSAIDFAKTMQKIEAKAKIAMDKVRKDMALELNLEFDDKELDKYVKAFAQSLDESEKKSKQVTDAIEDYKFKEWYKTEEKKEKKVEEYLNAWEGAHTESNKRISADQEKHAKKILDINTKASEYEFKKRSALAKEHAKKIVDINTKAAEYEFKKRSALAKEHAKQIEQVNTNAAEYEFKKRSAMAKEHSRKMLDINTKAAEYEFKKRSAMAKEARAKEASEAKKHAKKIADINLRAAEYEFKKRSAAAAQARKKEQSFDFSGHRGLIDSTLVVAKYGAISQALYAIQTALRSVGEEIMRFDQSIYSNMAVLDKSYTHALRLSNTVVELATTYGTSASDIQSAMLTIGRAGVDSTKQIQQATKVLAELALITGDSMSDGAAGVSTMLSVYPQLTEEIGMLGEKMAVVANATRLGLKDFTTISNYALTTAKSIGLSSDAYLALAGAMSKVGLNASTIGTSIRRLKKFTDSTSTSMVKFFRILGTSQKEFSKGLSDDPENSLINFSRALATLQKDGSDRYKRMTQDLNIFEKATIDTFAAIGDNDYMAKIIGKIDGVTPAMKNLEKQTSKMASGLERSFAIIKTTIATSFNTQALELFNGMFDRENYAEYSQTLKELSRDIVDVAKWLAVLAGAFVANVLGLKAITAATYLWNKALKVTTVSLAGFGQALKKNLIGIAVIAAYAAYVMWTEKATEAQNKLTDAIALTGDEVAAMGTAARKDTLTTLYEGMAAKQKEINDLRIEGNYIVDKFMGIATGIRKVTEEDRREHELKLELAKEELAHMQKVLEVVAKISKQANTPEFTYGAEKQYVYTAKELAAKAKSEIIEGRINSLISDRAAQYLKLQAAQVDMVTKAKELEHSEDRQGEYVVAKAKADEASLAVKKYELKLQIDIAKASKVAAGITRDRLVEAGKLNEFETSYLGLLEDEKQIQSELDKINLNMADKYKDATNAVKETTEYKTDQLAKDEKINDLAQVQLNKIKAVNSEMYRLAGLTAQATQSAIALSRVYSTMTNQLAEANRQMALLAGTSTVSQVRVEAGQEQINMAKEEVGYANQLLGIAVEEQRLAVGSEAIKQANLKITEAAAQVALKDVGVRVKEVEMAKMGRDINNEKLEQERNVNMELEKQSIAMSAALPKKERALAVAKAESAVLAQNVIHAQQMVSANPGNENYENALLAAKTAELQNQKRIKEETLDVDAAALAAAEKAGSAAEKAGKAADKNAVFAQRVTEELGKQAAIRVKIESIQKGEAKSYLTRLKNAKEVYKIAQKTAKDAKKLIKGQRSEARYQKDKTKEMKAQLNVLKIEQERLQDIHKIGESLFDNLISGDFSGALESFSTEVIELMVKPIQDAFTELFDDTFGKMLKTGLDAITNAMIEMTTKSVAQSQIVGQAAAPTAIVKGAEVGGWYGMAAMAAVVAALGFGVGALTGGGGGAEKMASAKATAETNSTPMSDSITDTLEFMSEQDTLGLGYAEQMVDSLKNIETLTLQAANQLTPFMTGSGYTESSTKGFWNDSSTELLEAGIQLAPATIDQIRKGQMDAASYQVEATENSGWLGIGSGVDISTTLGAEATNRVMAPIEEAYLEGVKAMESAATTLGVTSAEFNTQAENWETTAHRLNMAGLDAQEQAELIQGAISADIDVWAGTIESIQPMLEQYAIAGEASGETMMRLASEYEVVDKAMRAMGETLPPVAEGGLDVSSAMVRAAGGLEKFAKGAQDFADMFYSDAKNATIQAQDLKRSFEQGDRILPATRAQFVQVYETAMKTGEGLAFYNDRLEDIDEYYTNMGQTANGATESVYNLSGSVGTLGSSCDSASLSAGTCGSSMNSCGLAADSCGSSMEDLYESLMSIANLKAEWMGEVEGAQLILDTTAKQTGLTELTVENFLEKFNEALSSDGVMGEDDLERWSDMSAALQGLESAIETWEDGINTQLEIAREFNTTMADFQRQDYEINQGVFDPSMLQREFDAADFNLAEVLNQTELFGVTAYNYQKKFFEAMEEGLTGEEIEEWYALGEALLQVDQASKNLETTLSSLALIAQSTAISSNFAMRQAQIAGESTEQAYQMSIDASARMLESIHQQTGIYGVTSEDYLSKFQVANDKGLTSEELANWDMLGSALLDVEDAMKTMYDAAMTQYNTELANWEKELESLDSLLKLLADRIDYYENGASNVVDVEDIVDQIALINGTTNIEELTDLTKEGIKLVDDYYKQQVAIYETMIKALDVIGKFVDTERMSNMSDTTAENTYKFYLDKVQKALEVLDSDNIGELVNSLTKAAKAYLDVLKTTSANTAEYDYERNVMLNALEDLADEKDPFVLAIEELQEQAVYWLKQIDAHIQNIKIDVGGSAPTPPTYPDAPTISDPVTQKYNDILGRDPTAAGLAYWTDQVNTPNGVTMSNLGESIALGAAENGEMSRREYVDLLYRRGLGRAPTPAGLDYWTYDSLTPLRDLVAMFVSNDPSYKHFAQGGIVTKPVNALIGEAGYPEAVIPLKDPNDPLGTESLKKLIREEMGDLVNEIIKLQKIDAETARNTKPQRIVA